MSGNSSSEYFMALSKAEDDIAKVKSARTKVARIEKSLERAKADMAEAIEEARRSETDLDTLIRKGLPLAMKSSSAAKLALAGLIAKAIGGESSPPAA